MKKKLLLIPLALLLALSLVTIGCPVTPTPPSPPARAIDAIVSTQWLEDNIDNPNLVILDVREPDGYTAGHIPGSVNIPAFPNWFVNLLGKEWPWMELPEEGALFTTIGNAGITANSTVVVIARTVDSPSGPARWGVTMAARAAVTLIYAGVKNVAMLDGGYAKWAAEGRATSTEPVTPTAVTYTGVVNETIFVSRDYVEGKVGKSTLVDTREADTYYGIGHDPSSKRAGHIPTSKNLPAPWFWAANVDKAVVTTCMTWKDTSAIREIALTVLGKDGDEEIIIYCGVGGYASPVYYVLTEVIGYTNVKFYDGSMQEWTADPEAPVTKYKYE
jgi:thiosulfate/3-mercaptopyruvate sulfurtransferase